MKAFFNPNSLLVLFAAISLTTSLEVGCSGPSEAHEDIGYTEDGFLGHQGYGYGYGYTPHYGYGEPGLPDNHCHGYWDRISHSNEPCSYATPGSVTGER